MGYPMSWDGNYYGGGYNPWPPYPRPQPQPKTGDIVYANLNPDGSVDTFSAAKWGQKVINFYDSNDNGQIDIYHELGFDQAWGSNDITVSQWLSMDVDRNGQINNKELASMTFINDKNKDGIFDRKNEQTKFTDRSYNDVFAIIDQHNLSIDLIDSGLFDPARRMPWPPYPIPYGNPYGESPWTSPTSRRKEEEEERGSRKKDPWSMPDDSFGSWF